MTGTNTDMKHPMCKAFLSAFVIFLIGILPILIASGGVYIWTGDYPAQTIVFIERIHRMLHSGQGLPAFDWGSMLGMDFLTSYHDHLFSPFEWFLYALPYAAVPYAHSLFMAGKIGLSAVTAYAYCRQYVKSNQTAYICGLLYAFSGFQIFNLVYQFSDRYLLFPLLLYCFDRLVIDKKPFCFAALLALNCLISPYFTWMICLFLLIYYVVRTATGSFPRLNLRLFLRLGLESVCGVFGGSIVLLPFYRVLSGNTRAS
ncbi:MAG: YfhO family protein, partial [Oscillospiraceae bacterium]|nr:YfhO family protein [Oscillospiraceae bacterium]